MAFRSSSLAGILCLFTFLGSSFSQTSPSAPALSFSPRWSLELQDYQSLNRIVQGGGSYVAYSGWAMAGSMGKVNLGISQDGCAWANKELAGTSPGGPGGMGQYVVGYGGNDWLVALSSGSLAAGLRIFRSSDAGETWNELIDVSFSDSFSGWPSEPLVYAQGAWFLSSGSSIYASSDRGSTWTRRPSFWSPSSPSITLIGQANDVLFARGNVGTLFYSTDGAFSWTQASMPSGIASILDVAHGNGIYVAVTSGGGVLSSSDHGANWTLRVT